MASCRPPLAFAPHCCGDPWPYREHGDLADPDALEAFDDRVIAKIPLLAAAM